MKLFGSNWPVERGIEIAAEAEDGKRGEIGRNDAMEREAASLSLEDDCVERVSDLDLGIFVSFLTENT